MRDEEVSKNRLLRFSHRQTATLANNRDHQFAASHALCIYRSNTIYSFIPKNACSTLRLSIAMANGCIASKADFNWIHTNNSTFVADLRDLACASYSFVILRCPYSRLASAYLDKIVGKKADAWQLHNASGRTTEPGDLTFRCFVQQLKKPKLLRLNHHWKPQVSFLVYEKYDDYFCLEAFDQAKKTLNEKIKLQVVDARGLLLHGSDQYTAIGELGAYSDIAADKLFDLKRVGQIPTPQSLYDTDIVSLVKEIYGEDIDLYQQQFGDSHLLFR